MSDLGDMIVKYSADVSGLLSGASQAKSALSDVSDSAQSSGNGIFGGFGKAISGAVSFGAQVGQTVMGIQGLASGASSLAQALLAPAATAETTQLSFETLLHSTSAAKQEMMDLNTFAAGTPMQTQWVDNAAAKILAFGGKVGDVKPEITAIGDSLSGLGKLSDTSLNSIVDIFGKISAQGKITGGDMMQLSTWGIPAWQALSDSMHKPIPELQKMVSAGVIPAKEAIKDLEGGMEKTFGGGMAKQANTFSGLMSTLASNWQIAMAAIGGPALKLAEQGLSQVGDALSSPAFQDFATGVGQNIANIFSQIGGFISSTVVPAFQRLQPVVQQFIAYFQSDRFAEIYSDFQTVGYAVLRIAGAFHGASDAASGLMGGAMASLPGLLQNIFEKADQVMYPLGQFLIWVQQVGPGQDIVRAGLIGIGVAFAAIQIGSFLATLPAIVGGFIAWGIAAWGAAAGVIAATWPILAIGAAIAIVVAIIVLAVQHWGDIVNWLQNVWGGIVAFFEWVWNGIVAIFSGIGAWFAGVFAAVGNAFSALGTMIHDKVTEAANAFKNIIGAIGQWFQDRGRDIANIAHNIGEGIINAFKWMYDHNTYWKAMVDGIVGAINGVKAWLATTWAAITGAIATAWKWLVDTATSVWNAVSGAITTAVTTVWNWLVGIWNTVSAWLASVWKAISDKATQIWNTVSGAISKAVNAVWTWLQGVWNTASKWLQDQWNKIAGFATSAWKSVSDVFSSIWSKYISGPLSSVWNQITGWFTNLGNGAKQSGQNFISMLVDGIKSGAGAIWDAVTGIAGNIWKALGFHSPAKAGPGADADKWMPNLIGMFERDLNAGAPRIGKASANVAQQLYPIKPSATAVASSVAMQQVAQTQSGVNLTAVLEVDGMQLAHIVQKNADSYVRLKLGAKGRAA